MDCNKDKEKQVDNLINLVENHTRTQRHIHKNIIDWLLEE